MRIALRFSAAFLGVLLVVMAAQAGWGVYSDWRAYQRDVHRDHRLIGSALAGAVARVWGQQGRAEADSLVRDAGSGDVRIAILERLPSRGPSAPLPVEEVRQRVTGDELVTRIPISTAAADEGLAWLEVTEPLRTPRSFIGRSALPTGLVALLSALLYAALAAWLGIRFIGRPIERLVSHARRIRGGDLEQQRYEDLPDDELHELAHELNAVSKQLDDAAGRVGDAESRAGAAEERAREAVDQLRHADRLASVGRVAASLAHELGTPLSIMSGRAQMIARGRVAEADIAGVGQIIADEGQRVATMIRHLLDFSRRSPGTVERFDLAAQVRSWRAVLEPLAKRQSVTLEVDAPEPTFLDAEPALVQQVVSNLIVNAIHAMPEGGRVTVRVGKAGEQAPMRARITVVDDGVGMADDVLARAFEPFFTTKGAGAGTGLGLAVVGEIVDDLGGTVELQSAKGEGTTASVLLPLASEDER